MSVNVLFACFLTFCVQIQLGALLLQKQNRLLFLVAFLRLYCASILWEFLKSLNICNIPQTFGETIG